MAEEQEFSNVYTIPPNYTDSGKLMGGMLETRNTVEAGALLLLVGYAGPHARHRESGSHDRDPAAAGCLCSDGIGRRLSAPVRCPYDSVLAQAAAAALQEDWI